MNRSTEGPMITDEEFFKNCLNLDDQGMENVKKNVLENNYREARKKLASFIRETLQPERFFKIPYEEPENMFRLEGESDEAAAKRICENILISCGTLYDFKEKVDWSYNPTFNQYKEWTWQLSRHNDLKHLAFVYRKTKNEEIAKGFARLIESWIRQAVVAENAHGYETLCWRTIECGIRMGSNWPYMLHAFYETEAFSDDLLIDFYKSIYEHGERLYCKYTTGNWLVMEMNGLAQIGILYPMFRKSKEWLDFALNKLELELKNQIYPDGFQIELSTTYHDVVINNYQRLMDIAIAYEIDLPDSFYDILEKASLVEIKLMMPNGYTPDINDGFMKAVEELILPKTRLFPQNKEMQWIISQGREGEEPEENSFAFSYAGLFVMRTGWGKDDIWALFDGGPFGRAHQHEDKLSILLYSKGKLILTEGGNYAYDDSKMRDYVLSTRAHNTMLVEGKGQNRRKNYHWEDQDINKKADFTYRIQAEFDFVEASYDEGYGDKGDISTTHTRSVYFLKNPGHGLSPFFIVVDRMKAEKELYFTSLWHMDTKEILFQDNRVVSNELTIITTKDNLHTNIISAQETPEWQGYRALSTKQGDYAPTPTFTITVRGKEIRTVTLLYPDKAGCSFIKEIKAGKEISDKTISIYLQDNICLNYSEDEFRI